MKNFWLSALLLLAACSTPSETQVASETQDLSSAEISDSIPPSPAVDYVKQHFSGWEISSNKDYSNLWWSFYGKSDITSHITADFNDDARSDYALLLKSAKEKQYKLVFLVSDKESFRHFEAPDFQLPFAGNDLEYGIFVEPPGQIDVAYPEIKSLILKSNAITLRNLEVSKCIYYWEDNGFKIFTMGRG